MDVRVTSAFIRHLTRIGEHLQIASEDILAAGKVCETTLHDPDGSVSVAALDAIWAEIDRRTEGSAFGAASAHLAQPESFGVAGLLIALSGSLRDAAPAITRYRPLICSAFAPDIQLAKDRIIFRFPVHATQVGARRSWNDAEVTAVLTMLQRATGHSITPLEVKMRHRGRRDRSYDEWFDGNVRFGSAATTLILPIEVADMPFRESNARVRSYLVQHAERLLERAVARHTCTQQVLKLLPNVLFASSNPEPAVARALGVSERTLQRYLRNEGTFFGQLLEETRRQLAEQYLEDPSRSLAEISALLGYSDVSSFCRAFKRWTRRTPRSRQMARVAADGA